MPRRRASTTSGPIRTCSTPSLISGTSRSGGRGDPPTPRAPIAGSPQATGGRGRPTRRAVVAVMAGYAARRLFGALPILFGLSMLVFTLIQLPPGGPVDFYASQSSRLSTADRQALQHLLGLDRPLPVQYLYWLSAVSRGDWG